MSPTCTHPSWRQSWLSSSAESGTAVTIGPVAATGATPTATTVAAQIVTAITSAALSGITATASGSGLITLTRYDANVPFVVSNVSASVAGHGGDPKFTAAASVTSSTTVALVDSSQQCPTWCGDWVEAKDLGKIYNGTFYDAQGTAHSGNFELWEIIRRLSPQDTYNGTTQEIIYPGALGNVSVTVGSGGGHSVIRVMGCSLLSPGGWIGANLPVKCQFSVLTRSWDINNAACT